MTWNIASYSATAGSNTSVNGTSIAEGCAPSGINDALRQIMADLATFSNGQTLLGSAAASASTAFCQVSNNLSDVTAATARTNLGLGTSATHASTDYLLVANNLSDVTAATARTNLGLGTAATATTGTSGATLPFLNGSNTWTGTQNFSGATVSGLTGTLTAGSLNTVNPYDHTTHTVAHGLGGVPAFIKIHLICVTAELGYSINDVIPLNYAINSTNAAFTVSADATNTYFAGASAPSITNRSTNGSGSITEANWKIVVTPYKLN